LKPPTALQRNHPASEASLPTIGTFANVANMLDLPKLCRISSLRHEASMFAIFAKSHLTCAPSCGAVHGQLMCNCVAKLPPTKKKAAAPVLNWHGRRLAGVHFT
jgi:hypothetical protein